MTTGLPPEEGKSVAGMAWLTDLSVTESQPAYDDRFAAVVAADPDHLIWRVAVRVRAVTPGTYVLPGASFADMYRPAVFARQAEAKVTILSAQ